MIGCDIGTWVFVLIAWSSRHVVFIIFVSHAESLVHSLEFWTVLFWAENVFISLIDKFLFLVINMDVNLLPMWTPLCLLNKIILCNFTFPCILLYKYVYQDRECHMYDYCNLVVVEGKYYSIWILQNILQIFSSMLVG